MSFYTKEKFVKTKKEKCSKCEESTTHSIVYDKPRVRAFKRAMRLFKQGVLKKTPEHPGYTSRCTVCHAETHIKEAVI